MGNASGLLYVFRVLVKGFILIPSILEFIRCNFKDPEQALAIAALGN